jgi:phosphate transport system permease protein
VFGTTLLLIALITAAAYWAGRTAARRFVAAGTGKVHSLPSYHGAYVAAWVGLPAVLLAFSWLAVEGTVLDRMLVSSLPESLTAGKTSAAVDLVVSEIKNVAAGRLFSEPSPEVTAAAERLVAWRTTAGISMIAAVAALAAAGLALARRRLAPRFTARNRVERIATGLMVACSAVAVLTTLGIVLSLIYEAIAFFRMVPVTEFLFGLKWEPQIALRADQVAGQGAFGIIPVFTGTLLISAIALLVSVPIGLFTAVYLVEYAADSVRLVVKPVLEILAGIPTVVFGFFAILVVAPAIRNAGDLVGLVTSPNSALAAGLVMGVMIIPFISSLADDALRAVPRSMRDGSLALGATPAETMTRVLLPAALPGIMGGVLLAASRAIGETMIVAMAAGLIATLTLNPLSSVTTVTVQIVTLLTGDSEFDSPKTLAAFALGLVLFLVTLTLNVVALRIVQKYREQYE